MEVTFIQGGDPYSVFINTLRMALESSKIQVVNTRKDATAVLHIVHQTSDRRVLSVDQTGKALEFLIHYEVEFELRGAGDEVILPVQKVASERAFVFVKTGVLGAEREANYIRDELERELVTLVMLRLTAISS
jgi:LPS-assembly lipoprotein